jgi:hypothetical protein
MGRYRVFDFIGTVGFFETEIMGGKEPHLVLRDQETNSLKRNEEVTSELSVYCRAKMFIRGITILPCKDVHLVDGPLIFPRTWSNGKECEDVRCFRAAF